MLRFARSLLVAALTPAVLAQEIPGLRASLFARSLVPATANVELRLVLQVDADLELPAALLSGIELAVKCDDATVPFPVQPGKPGTVSLAGGTIVERTLRFPASAFVAGSPTDRIANVSVTIVGLPAAACAFKIAPDVSKLDVSTLDLAKTEVVLVTNFGDMRVSFRPDKAPKTVAAFVDLCRQGFYDGTKFYRVVRDFMIQGGCPLSKDDSQPEAWGGGTNGVRLKAEWSDLRHLRGTLAMARGEHPDSADCHFFILHKDSPHLDGRYTAFGNLEAGADVLDRIAETPVGGPKRETPLRHVILHAAIVLPVKK